MSMLPKLPNNFVAERRGVLKIASLINEQGHIFRETPHTDVGIDGQVEFVNDTGEVTGQMIAIQIKYGDSYLKDHSDHYVFYVKAKHMEYWATYPLSVILFVYSPKDQCTYFVNVSEEIKTQQSSAIKIPKVNIYERSNRDTIFGDYTMYGSTFLNNKDLLEDMVKRRSKNPTFAISFFDLFVQGLTNICRHSFFSMSLATDIADYNNDSDFGLSLGFDEYEFLHDYAKYVLAQNLVKIDYDDYLIDWEQRQLVPSFYAPLTERGRMLINYIREREQEMDIGLNVSIISEMLIRREYLPSDFERLEKTKFFQKKYLSD